MPSISRKLPDLGDASKTFIVELTEPEINALYGVLAFVRGAVAEIPKDGLIGTYVHSWYDHYRNVLEKLDDKLKQFDGL